MTPGKCSSIYEHQHRLLHNRSTLGDEPASMIHVCCMKALASLLSYLSASTVPPHSLLPSNVPWDTFSKTRKFREVTKLAFVTN